MKTNLSKEVSKQFKLKNWPNKKGQGIQTATWGSVDPSKLTLKLAKSLVDRKFPFLEAVAQAPDPNAGKIEELTKKIQTATTALDKAPPEKKEAIQKNLDQLNNELEELQNK